LLQSVATVAATAAAALSLVPLLLAAGCTGGSNDQFSNTPGNTGGPTNQP
jgi:hypothetical protein